MLALQADVVVRLASRWEKLISSLLGVPNQIVLTKKNSQAQIRVAGCAGFC